MSEYKIGDRLVVDPPNGQAKPVVATVTGIITNSNTGEVVAYMTSKRKIRPEEIHYLAPGRPEPGSVSEALDRINTADSDPVNHPAHYGGDTTYEVIKVITAWGLGFDLGNVTKYVARAGKKDPSKELEDLRKARFYLNHRINTLEQS